MAYHTEQLPASIRQQVEDFIEFLLQRQRRKQPPQENPRLKLYGAYRGKIWMADDFDAPLDDFQAYM
jgi:hypothetical protein